MARGAMPRRVQAEAAILAKYAALAQNPKMLAQVDQDRVAEAYDTCVRHLNSAGRLERVWSVALGIASSILFRMLVVGGLFLWFLIWKGFVQ